ncbi:Uncharacterized protein FKW44_020614 [Caligus rogercresseyi]|uniref:Bestrophin homolog n=1 Tax=Caligus rogercresseyi TaxID=217165 RepID=A0A7T8GXK8_CALRO|nr:Uncharacterized protein FKW44_020614 [Caligus rogercresseyi]
MTVSYTAEVANASSFGCFTLILFRWKGSLYKLIFKELFVYLTIYALLNIFYFVVLQQDGLQSYRQLFEAVKAYCSIQISSIPMTFGLGFYVSIIVKRWWDQYQLLPWPDSLAIYIVSMLQGLDERSRMMRRNIMRYTLLSYVITLRRISFRVRKRFPTMQHVVDAGLMRPDELKCMELMDEKCSVSKWWMPLVWASQIVDKARQEQKIKSDPGMQTILKEISSIREGLTGSNTTTQFHRDPCGLQLLYSCPHGGSVVTPERQEDYKTTYRLPTFKHETVDGEFAYYPINLYFPLFPHAPIHILRRVAQTKLHHRSALPVAYLIVDEMQHSNPELLKDLHWNETVPTNLPYTEDTEHYRKEEPKGGAEKVLDDDMYGYTNYSKYGFLRRSSNLSFSKSLTNGNAVIRGGDPEPSSDYESVDTSIVGWWKNKLRRSQIRKSGSNLPHRKSTKSLKSQNISSNGNNVIQEANSHLSVQSEIPSKDAQPDSRSKSPLAGGTDEEDSFDNDYDFDRFRNQSHLTTITENQNSPYSTHNGSRRNSRPYPNAEGLFDPPTIICKSLSDVGSNNYYPLSENEQAAVGDPGLGLLMKTPKRHLEVSSVETPLPIPTGMEEGSSPALPKRQARLAFDAIKLSKAMESFVKPSSDSLEEMKKKVLDDTDEMDVKEEENSTSSGKLGKRREASWHHI